jgi:hypothetical protein
MGMEDFLAEQKLTPIVAELISICKEGNADKALNLIHSLIRTIQAVEVLAQFNVASGEWISADSSCPDSLRVATHAGSVNSPVKWTI